MENKIKEAREPRRGSEREKESGRKETDAN